MSYQPPQRPDQQPPYVPGQAQAYPATRRFEPPQPYAAPAPEPSHAPVPPPKKDWGPGKIILTICGVIAGFCLLGGFIAAVAGGKNPPRPATNAGAKTVSTGAATQGAAQPADEPKAGMTPKPADFKLTAKVTRKHCFGTAGCNVNYKVDLQYSGQPLDDTDTWEITYEATGDESGPVVSQLEVTGQRYSGEEQSISTSSEDTPIKIKVTDVEKQ